MEKTVRVLAALCMSLAALAGCESGAPKQGGTATDISSYTPAKPREAAPVHLENPGFERGRKGWCLPETFRVEPGAGRDGTAALVCEKGDPNLYKVALQEIPLKPNTSYRFGCWIRAEKLEGQSADGSEEGAKLAMQFSSAKDGKYLGGQFIWEPEKPELLVKGTTGWKWIESSFITPDEPIKGQLLHYVKKGVKGKAYFDDAIVEELPPEYLVNLLQPKFETLDAGAGSLTLGFDSLPQDTSGLSCLVATADGESKDLKPIVGKRCELALGKLKPGPATLSVSILDNRRKEILNTQSIPVLVAEPRRDLPPNSCAIDGNGRTMLDGAAFMPLGLYVGNVDKQMLERLSASPFNCVMPYCSLGLKLDGSGKSGVAAINESLDALDAHKIKCIFSLKDVWSGSFLGYPNTTWMGAKDEFESVTNAVNAFKGHPAILAWYLADELPWEWRNRLTDRRRLVNGLDPFHPTWAVYNKSMRLPYFASSCDAIGVDPYPIGAKDSKSMHSVKSFMDAAAAAASTQGGAAVWAVPQATCLERFPTVEEMRSIALLEAAMGARGFIFYSYGDLWKGVDAATGDARWADLRKLGEELKSLEPFIMSAAEAPRIAAAVTAGDVVARGLKSDDGRLVVIVAGIGPGDAKATVDAGVDGLKSRHGKCKGLGAGKYLFEGKDICADILE